MRNGRLGFCRNIPAGNRCEYGPDAVEAEAALLDELVVYAEQPAGVQRLEARTAASGHFQEGSEHAGLARLLLAMIC